MSANHAKHFETRKASAEETARWMLPEVQRAAGQGFDDVMLKVRDVTELLAYVEAVAHRDKVEFGGKLLGYAQPKAMREMLSRKRNQIDVMAYPSKIFSAQVSFTDLPPKGDGDE